MGHAARRNGVALQETQGANVLGACWRCQQGQTHSPHGEGRREGRDRLRPRFFFFELGQSNPTWVNLLAVWWRGGCQGRWVVGEEGRGRGGRKGVQGGGPDRSEPRKLSRGSQHDPTDPKRVFWRLHILRQAHTQKQLTHTQRATRNTNALAKLAHFGLAKVGQPKARVGLA